MKETITLIELHTWAREHTSNVGAVNAAIKLSTRDQCPVRIMIDGCADWLSGLHATLATLADSAGHADYLTEYRGLDLDGQCWFVRLETEVSR